jgi:oligopeptidase B
MKKHSFYLYVLLPFLCCAPSFVHSQKQVETAPVPPVAIIIPHVDTIHGDIRVDNYFWLRARDNPEVLAYLNAENAYTEAMMKHTEALQEKLYHEMLSRIKETDLSVPEKIDNYYYYSRTEEGKQYTIYCRKKESLNAEEEIILDQNVLAEGKEYFEVGVLAVSPNHELLIYSTDTVGSERYTLRVKNLTTGELYDEAIPATGYSVAWANDNKTFFYTIIDETERPYVLRRHVLGTNPELDEQVYYEADSTFWLSVSRTRSRKYLIIDTGSRTSSEVYYLDANTPADRFRLIQPRMKEIEYYVEHHGAQFYILTNEDAENYKVMVVSADNPSKDNWKEYIAHRDSVKIESIDAFKEHLVVHEREKGLPVIRIVNPANRETHYVEFPEPVYSYWPTGNREYNTHVLRFTYTSLTTPRSVFDYDMVLLTRELKKQYEVVGGYDPTQYQSERNFSQASDGTEVPISLVYQKGLAKNGTAPLLLYGYGAYGSSEDPYFSSTRLSILDRGCIYAIAHVRGGGEMGRHWYEQGKLFNKMNTFTDFIACAEHLINEKYTSPDRFVISSSSAGGLVIGAVINMRPELFAVATADVPFVDLLNTMLDPTIPLTVLDYDEWGDPNRAADYCYMKTYSPYDNVAAHDYPNLLITAGLYDARVQYWEPAKWAAKLRARKTDNNVLLLTINMGSGHLGASGRYDFLKDIAFEYAFIIDMLGLEK